MVSIFLLYRDNSTSIKTEVQSLDNNLVTTSFVIIDALENYYFAGNTNPDPNNSGTLFSGLIFTLSEQNRHLANGNNLLLPCSKDSNEVIKKTCYNLIQSANIIIYSNEKMISSLKNYDSSNPKTEQELKLTTSENVSAKTEGYRKIYESAPLLAELYFKGEEPKNPAGEILYSITKAERNIIIKKIDDQFGEYIKKDDIQHAKDGNYNAVVSAVLQLKSSITYDTYETRNKAMEAESN